MAVDREVFNLGAYTISVSVAQVQNRTWRKGQAYFNTLALWRPDLADRVRGAAGLDPFHEDANVPALLIWLAYEVEIEMILAE